MMFMLVASKKFCYYRKTLSDGGGEFFQVIVLMMYLKTLALKEEFYARNQINP